MIGIAIAIWVWVFLFIWSNDPLPEVVVEPSASTIEPEGTEELVLPQVRPTRTLYALGDSLTAWYQLPLEDSYPSQLEQLLQADGYAYDVVNGWRSGDTSWQLLSRMERLLEDAQPWDIAVVVIGANDGFQSLPLSQLETNIESIITRLQANNVSVVLGGMQIPTNLSPEYRNDFAAIYPRLAQEYDIPLIPFFLENVAAVPSLNLPDGIHPTAQWYALLAQQTKEFLEENEILVK